MRRRRLFLSGCLFASLDHRPDIVHYFHIRLREPAQMVFHTIVRFIVCANHLLVDFGINHLAFLVLMPLLNQLPQLMERSFLVLSLRLVRARFRRQSSSEMRNTHPVLVLVLVLPTGATSTERVHAEVLARV